MYNTPQDMTSLFYRPLVDIWGERLAAARTSKIRFQKIADQCVEFYEAGAGFMWENKFNNDYFGGRLPSPKFRITIAKLYEFVSIYGPHLFWQYPKRKVISQRSLVLRPEMFGDPNDPTVQQVFQQVFQQDKIEQAISSFSNEMMGNYLDWSQREQPGGLALHGNLCVQEMLLKGLGTLWPDVYSFPGSQEKFTRLRFKTVNNFFVDPDCKDPLLETAGYIALRHVSPVWELEKKFNLPKGTLAGKGNVSSMEQISRNNTTSNNRESNAKRTHDLIEWWEIWSKCGVGPRGANFTHQVIDEFDEVLGDFAYLCIAKGIPFPLNAPPNKFFGDSAADSEQVREMFEWRFADYGEKFPCYKDGRWPVALLSVNKLSNSPWPLAPAAPGLGELIGLNILTSTYVDQAWNNRKQIIGYIKSALADVKAALDSESSTELIPINDALGKSVSDLIQYIQAPNQNSDLLQAIEMLSQNFDKRVGLSELQYGMSSTQIRVASDVRTRSENANIRPEKMSRDVAAWMSEASQLEMFAAILYVNGVSLTHLLGGYGGSQWDALIKSMPVEQAMREMKASVEASDIRRPNHERDTANMQALQQYITPLLQQYAMSTTDTQPLKEFFEAVSNAIESPALAKVAAMMGPWTPPPDEQTQQLMQAQLAADVQVSESDALQKQAAAKKFEAEAVAKLAEMGEDNAEGQQKDGMREVVTDEIKFRQALVHKQQEHEQKLAGNQQLMTQKLLFDQAQSAIRTKSMKDQAQASAIKARKAKTSNGTK